MNARCLEEFKQRPGYLPVVREAAEGTAAVMTSNVSSDSEMLGFLFTKENALVIEAHGPRTLLN